MKLETLGTVATWFFGKHGPTYLKIIEYVPDPTRQEQGPSWWTEVDNDGKTPGRQILERFWAEDR